MSSTRRTLLCGTCLALTAVALTAGCATPPSRVRKIDAQADPIFRHMCDTLDNAKALRFRVRATIDRPVETGQLAQFHRMSEIAVARPDRLYAVTDTDGGCWSAWYRGGTLTLLDRDANVYAAESVPGRIGDMLDYLADTYDLIMPMADFLIRDTYESMLADVDFGSYVGLHTVGDTKCHHLLFRQENIDWQIWIDAGKPPLPRKLVITYTREPDQPQYVAMIDEWDLMPDLPDKTFTFAPPAGATSTSMEDLIAGEQGEMP